ncbi:DUF998 domain-containing protein [Streptomyces sp. FH025]|uniref:DUF998 domain-containing protein n=1 Tax=Streptomyces sp. FH025 TaxID=2815937 RepID=UPI001A9D15FD|nr:DUF998 domain-containing protein [Streptomyces sp. FH025]MBO1414115.1 DUF998 domain-containing protein [Streptomyces sp. FH025]
MDVKVQKTPAFRGAGVLLVLAALQYVLLEYLAAAAWRDPPYSYAVGFISDLGNPVAGDVFDGRVVDSPLHLLMDIAFVAQGVLFIAAAVLLRTAVAGRLKSVLLALAIVHGVGVILVGFFHESSAALHNGVIVVHSIGAAAAILAGNAIPIVIGVRGERPGIPRRPRVAVAALGVLGLASFALLQADRPLYHAAGGVPERISVYAILAFELILGAALLARPSLHNSLVPAADHAIATPTERLSS